MGMRVAAIRALDIGLYLVGMLTVVIQARRDVEERFYL